MIVFISASWTHFSIKLILLEFHIMFRAWKTVVAKELILAIPRQVVPRVVAKTEYFTKKLIQVDLMLYLSADLKAFSPVFIGSVRPLRNAQFDAFRLYSLLCDGFKDEFLPTPTVTWQIWDIYDKPILYIVLQKIRKLGKKITYSMALIYCNYSHQKYAGCTSYTKTMFAPYEKQSTK